MSLAISCLDLLASEGAVGLRNPGSGMVFSGENGAGASSAWGRSRLSCWAGVPLVSFFPAHAEELSCQALADHRVSLLGDGPLDLDRCRCLGASSRSWLQSFCFHCSWLFQLGFHLGSCWFLLE